MCKFFPIKKKPHTETGKSVQYIIVPLPHIQHRVGYLRHNFSFVMQLLGLMLFSGAIMSAIYDEKKDEDGFLYVTYSGENTFGNFVLP